jgi:hypothetical protein
MQSSIVSLQNKLHRGCRFRLWLHKETPPLAGQESKAK